MTEEARDRATVLIVDDDQMLRRQLYWALEGEHHVLEAETRAAAVVQLGRGDVDVVLCDLHLPPDLDGITEGLAVVEAARALRPSVPVIVITGTHSKQAALDAIRAGASTLDYYGLPAEPHAAETRG